MKDYAYASTHTIELNADNLGAILVEIKEASAPFVGFTSILGSGPIDWVFSHCLLFMEAYLRDAPVRLASPIIFIIDT